VTRKIERLTVDHLPRLAGGCAECVFWELDPVRREEVRGAEAAEKAGWVSEVLLEWGSCGAVAVVDGEVVGHALWAPPQYVPGANGFATAPVSSDAVVLTTVYVDPMFRRGGLGRMLVQGMAKDLVRRGGVKAVEAYGDSRVHPRGCVVPTDFLLAVGFSTHRPHRVHPRMRMDLRTTLRIREELEKGLSKLLSPVQPRPAPAKGTPRL
jgi:GNAT superfamily N-acetyltransferase